MQTNIIIGLGLSPTSWLYIAPPLPTISIFSTKMDTPTSTQEHCPTCRRATDVEHATAASVRLIDAIERLVAKLDELIESQFEECLDAQS